MSLDALKEKVSEVILDDACSAEFYFILKEEAGITIKSVDIDQSASDELASNFIESIKNTFLLNDGLSLLNISGADDRTNAIYRYDLSEIPVQIKSLDNVLKNDKFEVFSFKTDELQNLEGILIILGHGQQQLAIYKRQYPVALLKRDSTFGLVRSENRLVKLEDDVLRINSKFEFMSVGGEYFIVDIKTLERFFGFHDAVRNVAVQGIANIDKSSLVVDTAVLTNRINDISFSRKLVRAAKASPVLGIVPNAQVIAFVENHPTLRGKFRLSDDGSKLKLDTKVSQDLFLKILNDDFLQSELTNRYYASLAKDNLEASAAPSH